jgi:hypothetical protein
MGGGARSRRLGAVNRTYWHNWRRAQVPNGALSGEVLLDGCHGCEGTRGDAKLKPYRSSVRIGLRPHYLRIFTRPKHAFLPGVHIDLPEARSSGISLAHS